MNIRLLMTKVVFGLAMTFSFNTNADTMSSEVWVQVETSVRALTVDGMERRLSLLSRNATLEEQAVDDEVTQEQITQMFSNHNTDAINHMQYYQANKEKIEQWLSEHQDRQADYQDVKQRFEAVLEKFQAFQSHSNSGAN